MSLTWVEATRRAAKGGPADRLRRALIVVCAALGVSIVSSAVTVPRYWEQVGPDDDSFSLLGSVLAQRGLAFGIMLTLALSAVPVIHLAMQAVRVGAPERDRRLAGMRAAGATGSDLRAVLRGEALVCTCVGVVAGLGTWALTLTALSRWVRIEYSMNWNGVEEGSMPLLTVLWPSPWLLVLSAVVVIAIAACVLPLSARRVTTTRRQRHSAEQEMSPVLAVALLASVAATVAAVAALFVIASLGGLSLGDSLLTNGLAGTLLIAGTGLRICALAAAGPGVARRVGRVLARRDGATQFLASRMLQAHPALAARTAVSLVLVAFIGGVAIPVKATLRAQAVQQVERNGEAGPGGADSSPDVLGYVVPATAVEVLVVVTACLASIGLLVAIREQVSLRGEALSQLTAQGVPARVLRRSLVLEAVAPSMVMSTVALIVGVVIAAAWGGGATGGFATGAMWVRLIGLWLLLVGGAAAAAHVGSRRVGREPRRIRDRE